MNIFENSTDEELVLLFRGGEERAFDELYNRYSKRLLRLVYFYTGDHEAAYDIIHDVFLRVVRHISGFDVSLSFSAWIHRIAINCSRNYLRSTARSRQIVEKEKLRIIADNREGSPSPEEQFISDEEIREFNRAVDNLKGGFRDVFMLRFETGMKYSEIAKVLKCSERTVKWRMHKALEHIAEDLKKRKII